MSREDMGRDTGKATGRRDPDRSSGFIPWKLIAAAAGILLAAFCIIIIRTGWPARSSEETGEAGGGTSADSGQEADVIWQGKGYNYNDHLSNFLFIGVDTREEIGTETGQTDAGQADSLYLVSWDRAENTAQVITIPRDTMTTIETFGPGGESLGKSTDHISLSYAFGDGSHESCRLAKEAVSSLFYDLPIQGYCSVNMDAIPILADSVGGVTVTVPNDSLEAVDPSWKEGAEVLITGENAERFVRYRDINVSQSAITRMERQQAFISAFGEKAESLFESDPGFVAKLYLKLEPYMVTNMGSDQFVSVMESVSNGETGEGWTVPGEGVEGKSFDEYYVDDEALYEKILETFYTETEQ